MLRLSHRASRVFKTFSDDDVIKVLSALTVLGQHDGELLAAMEKHLPGEISFPPVRGQPYFFPLRLCFPTLWLGSSGRLEKCDPELISTVMEYCLQMRCRSRPIFEAVAKDFVRRGEKQTTLQIAKQIIAMGRLNYLPEVSGTTRRTTMNQLCSRKTGFMSGLSSFCSVSAQPKCSRSWKAFCPPGSPSFSLAPF